MPFSHAYIDPGTGFAVFTVGGWFIAFLIGLLAGFLAFFKKIFKFANRRRKKIIAILAVLAAITGLIMAGVIMSEKKPKFEKRIIILGFDGLSPRIIEPMMEEGSLPNFSRLRDRGSYRRLSTTNPSQSPVAWSGFATGQNPGKNGVFDFIVRDPKTYGLSLCTTIIEKGRPKRAIKSKCFWQYASDAKVPAVIIGCPVTFPPDKLYGRMVSGMGVPDILGTQGTFSFYTTEPEDKGKTTGGKVFHLKKSPVMNLNLIGPRVAKPGGKSENAKVPFEVILKEDHEGIVINHQKNEFVLKTGRWSDWKEVTFKIGPLKRAKGIFKLYLVETTPEFKLYISPINLDPRDPFFPVSHPARYSKDLSEAIGLYHTLGMPMPTWAVNEKRLSEKPLLEQINEVLDEKIRMLDFELSRFKKGVLFCYFESPDIVQHMFWRYIDPLHPLYEKDAPDEYKETIKSWYRKMDGVLGNVMEGPGRNDTVIVLSDHGFGPFRRAAHVNTRLRENGYLELKNPHSESGAELLRDIDWSKTRAYSIGFGAIYINQKGRERDGIVKPGLETETLKKEISKNLENWMDEKHKKPVINKVYPSQDIFWGKHSKDCPDLYIGFNPGYRSSWQTALGAVPKETIEDNTKKWSGSHLFDPNLIPGILFSNMKIERKEPSIYDIAPTVLKLIGYDEKEIKKLNMDGEPL